jgi:hypothetical protein
VPTHLEVLGHLHIQQARQQLPAVQRCILAIRAMPVKHAEQVAAVQASELPDLDEELILVLPLEWAKAYVLQTSSLRSAQQWARHKQRDVIGARTGTHVSQAQCTTADGLLCAFALCGCSVTLRKHTHTPQATGAVAHPRVNMCQWLFCCG